MDINNEALFNQKPSLKILSSVTNILWCNV